ncbi:MAG: ABC transporter ATP-binding protein [Lachnospiraceae bacterium]
MEDRRQAPPKDMKDRPMPQLNVGGGGPRRGPMEKAKVKDIKQTIFRLWGYLSVNKVPLVIAFISVVIGCIASIVASYMVRPIINGIVAEAGMNELLKNLFIMFVVYIIALISNYVQARIMLEIAQNSLESIRKDLFVKLQKLPLRYYDSNNNGDLMSRFTNDVDAVSQMLSNTCVQLISGVVTFITTAAIMFYTNWLLTIIMLLVIPLITLVTKSIGKLSMKYSKAQQKAIGDLNGYIEESITGQKVVKVFNHEEEIIDSFEDLNKIYREKAFKAGFVSGSMGPVMGAFSMFSYVVTAFLGGMFCIFYGFDIGGYTIFVNYSRSLSRPINELSMQVNVIFSALAGAERVFEVMDANPEREDHLEATVLEDMKGHVVFDQVVFGYNPHVPVLKGVSIEAKFGQKIAFVGSTGAGKTTITNLVNRFYDIQEGQITIDGVDIRDIKKDFLRQNIAMVLQDTHLFTGTVRENIRYGRLDASDEDVIEAAKTANAHNFIIRLEKGYDTVLEGDGANLSQGQRQLLNIARAAISKAPILVLDEATSSVDTRTERHIEEALDRLMQMRTTFVIAHRLSTVRNSDIIMVLEHGVVIERGNHDELLALEGKYHSLYTGSSMLE